MDIWREHELYSCSTDARKVAPGQIPHHVATQFLHRYKRSDYRCNIDEPYCETNKVRCMVTISSATTVFVNQRILRLCLSNYDWCLIMFVTLIDLISCLFTHINYVLIAVMGCKILTNMFGTYGFGFGIWNF